MFCPVGVRVQPGRDRHVVCLDASLCVWVEGEQTEARRPTMGLGRGDKGLREGVAEGEGSAPGKPGAPTRQ